MLPRPEDLLATLTGGKCFSELVLSQAYLQVPLDEDSQCCYTVNVYQGLYRYMQLPFGVASAAALFQKLLDTVLQRILGVAWYVDDILISTKDEKQHLQTLGGVFRSIQKDGGTWNLAQARKMCISNSLYQIPWSSNRFRRHSPSPKQSGGNHPGPCTYQPPGAAVLPGVIELLCHVYSKLSNQHLSPEQIAPS